MILNDKEQSTVTRALSLLGKKLAAPEGLPTIEHPSDAIDYLRLLIGSRECETFVVLYLDAHYKMVDVYEVATGQVDETSAPPRPIIQRALDNCARFLIVAHNHPSGDCRPSAADRLATKTLVDAADLFGITVLDHFVIGRAPDLPAWSIGHDKRLSL